jgi:hypothetical protein
MNQMSSGPSPGFCPLLASGEDPRASVLVFGSVRRAGHPLTERVLIVKDAAKHAGVNRADPSRAIDMQPLLDFLLQPFFSRDLTDAACDQESVAIRRERGDTTARRASSPSLRIHHDTLLASPSACRAWLSAKSQHSSNACCVGRAYFSTVIVTPRYPFGFAQQCVGAAAPHAQCVPVFPVKQFDVAGECKLPCVCGVASDFCHVLLNFVRGSV